MKLFILIFFTSIHALSDEILLKVEDSTHKRFLSEHYSESEIEDLGFQGWHVLKTNGRQEYVDLKSIGFIVEENFKHEAAVMRNQNPDIPELLSATTTGTDPGENRQWGFSDIGVRKAWAQSKTQGSNSVVVAVIDSGVDYTHEDLARSIWRNPGETGLDSQGRSKATNGIDDDKNGFIDDVVGWDFVQKDNRPYDVVMKMFWGGNMGHGTHCAGNIAAEADNGVGIAGVAPGARIMVLRTLNDRGMGDNIASIRALKYAVDNGAKIISNSWGSEGRQSKALEDVVKYAQDRGVLLIAAAGNGRRGAGFNNDTDSKPFYPASYNHDNIVSVAAIDSRQNLARFSNWGSKTVDLAAPGVAVYSTVPEHKYMNMEGTSMACPMVAGAAALYWSKHPQANWKQVKEALLKSTVSVESLKGKVQTGGKLNVEKLMSL